jgi:hypothetical protein
MHTYCKIYKLNSSYWSFKLELFNMIFEKKILYVRGRVARSKHVALIYIYINYKNNKCCVHIFNASDSM